MSHQFWSHHGFLMIWEKGFHLTKISVTDEVAYICRITNNTMRDRLYTIELTKDELNSTQFEVWYRYKATQRDLLSSLKRKQKMTGFKLSWQIENGAKSKMTEN